MTMHAEDVPTRKPLMVLLGLIFGASFTPPMRFPPNIAIISTVDIHINKVSNTHPWASMLDIINIELMGMMIKTWPAKLYIYNFSFFVMLYHSNSIRAAAIYVRI